MATSVNEFQSCFPSNIVAHTFQILRAAELVHELQDSESKVCFSHSLFSNTSVWMWISRKKNCQVKLIQTYEVQRCQAHGLVADVDFCGKNRKCMKMWVICQRLLTDPRPCLSTHRGHVHSNLTNSKTRLVALSCNSRIFKNQAESVTLASLCFQKGFACDLNPFNAYSNRITWISLK